MAKKQRENLVWNAQFKQLWLEGESEIAAFEHIAAMDPSEAHAALDKAETVEISTWAVTVLANGWKRYIAAGGKLPLGKAFNLEANRQGDHHSLNRNEVNRKTFALAVKVQDLIDQGVSKTRAIRLVAEANGRSVAQLTKALRPPTSAQIAAASRRLKKGD